MITGDEAEYSGDQVMAMVLLKSDPECTAAIRDWLEPLGHISLFCALNGMVVVAEPEPASWSRV